MVDVFFGEHFAHIRPAGRVTDHRCAAADQSDRFVAGHLKALHQSQRHKMSGGEAVGRAVKADVKRRFAVVDHFTDVIFVRYLGDQSARLKLFIQVCHVYLLPFLFGRASKKPSAIKLQRATKVTAVPPLSQRPHDRLPHGVRKRPAHNVRARLSLHRTETVRSTGSSGMYFAKRLL